MGDTEKVLSSKKLEGYVGKIDLIFTSPPFPLIKKKKYGNLYGQPYLEWLKGLAKLFNNYLSQTGSVVIEIGNAWERGYPFMSTVPIETLLAFKKAGNFNLCQQFVWNNPARLPSPAQWVNVDRVRVKDSFTNIWWMSKGDEPKANNRNVLTEYSSAMKSLLERQTYNNGARPSNHNIGEKSFNKNNNGAIPSNVLTFSNTRSRSDYLTYCRENSIDVHPARMPIEIPEFFIKFLTDEGDRVLDPFSGSNTTGAAAENNNRNWIAIEKEATYVDGSRGRFEELQEKAKLS